MAKGNKEDLLFKAAGAAASAGIGLAAKYLPQFMNAVGSISEKVWKFITAWWNQQTVAVIGSTASGKDSLLARLQGKEAPSFHINTTTAEEVPSYRIDYKFEDGREICFDVAKGVNVGGEEDNREDDWGSALKKATLIFYLIDTPKLLEAIKTLPEGTEYRLSTLRKASPYFKRLIEDMRFVAASLHGKRLAVILNKIDLLPEDEDPQTLEEFIKPLVSEGLQGAKTSLRSVRPLSCQNKEIFESCFPIILKDISGY